MCITPSTFVIVVQHDAGLGCLEGHQQEKLYMSFLIEKGNYHATNTNVRAACGAILIQYVGNPAKHRLSDLRIRP